MGKLRGETVGERVRAAREAAGLKQTELAYKTGAAHSTINEIENGKRDARLETLEKIAAATNVSVADILDQVASAPERGTPNIEAAIEMRAQSGRPLSTWVVDRIRRYAATGGDFSPFMVENLINEAIAEEAGRRVERPADAEATLDQGAGERKARPRKPR